jgi:hypothetical protein
MSQGGFLVRGWTKAQGLAPGLGPTRTVLGPTRTIHMTHDARAVIIHRVDLGQTVFMTGGRRAPGRRSTVTVVARRILPDHVTIME